MRLNHLAPLIAKRHLCLCHRISILCCFGFYFIKESESEQPRLNRSASKSPHLTPPCINQCVLSAHRQTVWPDGRQTLASGRAELLIRRSQSDVIATPPPSPTFLVMGLHFVLFPFLAASRLLDVDQLVLPLRFYLLSGLSLITLLVFHAMQGSIFILDNSWVSPHSVGDGG